MTSTTIATPADAPRVAHDSFARRARALHTAYLAVESLRLTAGLVSDAMQQLAVSMETLRTDSDALYSRELVLFRAAIEAAEFESPNIDDAFRALEAAAGAGGPA